MPLRLRSSIVLLLAMAATAIAVLAAVRFAGTDHRSFPVPERLAIESTGLAELAVPPATNDAPRNVILLIGDGLGLGQLSSVSTLVHGPGGGLAVERAPVVGMMRTWARNTLITDSAAAGSAMATGLKTSVGTISTQPDGSQPVSLFEAAKARGMAIGFVTTSGIVDATPASFLAHAGSRYDLASILDQILRSDADVVVGGTFERHRRAMRQPDYLQLLDQAESVAGDGRRVVRSGAELAAAQAPVVALFPPRPGRRYTHGPPLAESVGRSLELLAGRPAGFLLVIESEDSDEGAHAHDLERVIEGLLELDAAVVRALAFAAERGDTLVVVTADHDTAGLAITDGDLDEGRATLRWLDHDHLSNWVPLFAFGPGAPRFAGVFDNTEIGRRIANLLGFEGFPPAS